MLIDSILVITSEDLSPANKMKKYLIAAGIAFGSFVLGICYGYNLCLSDKVQKGLKK